MGESDTFQIIILIIMLILSGFFSASETALLSLSKIRIRHMVEGQVKGAKAVEKLIENPDKFLGAVLLANNVVNIGSASLASSIAAGFFGSNGVVISTIIMTMLVLLFGEIVPKNLAQQNSEKVALKVVKTITIIVNVCAPIIWTCNKISNVFIRILGGDVNKVEPFITEEEFKTMVVVSEEEGVLEEEEKELIYNVFEFGDLQVKDIMIQRLDIVGINKDSNYEEILDILRTEQFSRLPVFDKNIDDVVGILNVKDLVLLNDSKENFDINKFIREPFYTFEFKKIPELLNEMRKTRNHIAVVLDEYGGTAGIVTIEDLIEELVGEIEDEYDHHENEIWKIKENEYVAEGSIKLNHLSEEIGIEIESEEFDSLGGYIIGILGRIPKLNEEIESKNIKFIVEDIKKNRIIKVRIYI
ncbi:MAG: hemolysin family protein [Clostridium perfringens]|nr:hemolysin family protein [Clostridium perfringens]